MKQSKITEYSFLSIVCDIVTGEGCVPSYEKNQNARKIMHIKLNYN